MLFKKYLDYITHLLITLLTYIGYNLLTFVMLLNLGYVTYVTYLCYITYSCYLPFIISLMSLTYLPLLHFFVKVTSYITLVIIYYRLRVFLPYLSFVRSYLFAYFYLSLLHHIHILAYLFLLHHIAKIKNHSTQDSRVVPHRGTNWAALWLTAQIRRDAVPSESYGRGYQHSAKPHIYVVHSFLLHLYEKITNY